MLSKIYEMLSVMATPLEGIIINKNKNVILQAAQYFDFIMYQLIPCKYYSLDTLL